MEGLGNTACSLECLACLNHVHGWTIWGGYGTLPLKPRFLVASDRSQVARRRVRLDLGDLGIIEQQLNQSSNQLGSPCPVVMHSVTGHSAYSWIGFFHHPSPLPRATYDWAYLIGSPFQALQCMDEQAVKTLILFLYVSKCRALFSANTTRRYEIDLATLIEHRKVMLSHEAQCDGIVAVGHDVL